MIDFLLAVPGKLTTIYSHLTTYLSSTRMAKVDNLDATMLSRAPAATAVSSADYTPGKAVFIDAAITSRLSSIKAIYRGTITIPYANPSATATITSVNTGKAFIFSLGTGNNGGAARVELTNGTTVTAYKVAGDGTDCVVGYQVIEFN